MKLSILALAGVAAAAPLPQLGSLFGGAATPQAAPAAATGNPCTSGGSRSGNGGVTSLTSYWGLIDIFGFGALLPGALAPSGAAQVCDNTNGSVGPFNNSNVQGSVSDSAPLLASIFGFGKKK